MDIQDWMYKIQCTYDRMKLHPFFLLLQPLLYAIAEGKMCIVRTRVHFF